MSTEQIAKNLLVMNDPKSIISEAYRMLRTNLQFMGVDKPIKTVAITSSNPGEGKSTIISNLAASFATTGDRVLLIDGDLRRPRINKFFHLENHIGLSSFLAGDLLLEKVIQETGVPGLDIITSGPVPPNPAEILGSAKMKEFLGKVSSSYDLVLIDTPPVNTVADTSILSTRVDGMILVVEAETTSREAVLLAKQQLKKVNARILGVVLNKVKKTGKGYYYYYYNDEN